MATRTASRAHAGGTPGADAGGSATRALVVVAHPDDADVNAGGTLRHWVADGVAITLLVVTSGDAGEFGAAADSAAEAGAGAAYAGAADAEASAAETGAADGIESGIAGTADPRGAVAHGRRAEQRAASAAVGIGDVRFLDGHRDGAVEVTTELVREIVRAIRRVRPHRVMTMSPERRWSRYPQWHPDHLAVGEATVRAVYPAARNPYAFPELLREEALEPWAVEELWVQDPPEPNHLEDVTDVHDLKVAAVLAHASQFTDPEGAARMLRERDAADGAAHGLPGRYVEPFRRVSL